ncbi:helix-turn-helix domain-containing protein [Roseibium sediminis]|uniref:helix-turn-helix domain-containing protein n=1 Tax=Roseibium sediminis TaxID=1775174 RepID=UPI00123DEF6A|nr:helix-turn-helix transcriptional regulator [Roseibium sediminis]
MTSISIDIKSIFGKNLRKLVGEDTPITEVARHVGVNRTQLNRYLYGEAFPRPDVLHRICTYFGVDARILTQSLAEIDADQQQAGPAHADVIPRMGFEPVDRSVFPDGFYVEWKPSWIYEGLYTQHLLLASTVDGRRLTRVRVPGGLRPDLKARRFQRPLIDYVGVAVSQTDGFVVFDQGQGSHGVAMTAFRRGFLNVENVYPGYKLSALVFNRQRHQFRGPTVLQYIGHNYGKVLRVARQTIWHKPDNVPRDIYAILEVMETEDRGLLPVPSYR